MLIDELKNRPSLILSEDEHKRYRLYASNREETKDLEILVELIPKVEYLKDIEIEMVGHISEVKGHHVNNIIKKLKDHTVRDGKEVEVFYEYPCYQEHKSLSVNNNVIKHEEKLSSFKCALELCHSEYFIIIKETPIALGEGILSQIIDHGNS